MFVIISNDSKNHSKCCPPEAAISPASFFLIKIQRSGRSTLHLGRAFWNWTFHFEDWSKWETRWSSDSAHSYQNVAECLEYSWNHRQSHQRDYQILKWPGLSSPIYSPVAPCKIRLSWGWNLIEICCLDETVEVQIRIRRNGIKKKDYFPSILNHEDTEAQAPGDVLSLRTCSTTGGWTLDQHNRQGPYDGPQFRKRWKFPIPSVSENHAKETPHHYFWSYIARKNLWTCQTKIPWFWLASANTVSQSVGKL